MMSVRVSRLGVVVGIFLLGGFLLGLRDFGPQAN